VNYATKAFPGVGYIKSFGHKSSDSKLLRYVIEVLSWHKVVAVRNILFGKELRNIGMPVK